MIHIEPLIHTALATDSLDVVPEADVDLAGLLPLVLFSASAPPTSNGPHQHAVVATVQFTILAADPDACLEAADQFVAQVDSAHTRQTPYGWVCAQQWLNLPVTMPAGPGPGDVARLQASCRLTLRAS